MFDLVLPLEKVYVGLLPSLVKHGDEASSFIDVAPVAQKTWFFAVEHQCSSCSAEDSHLVVAESTDQVLLTLINLECDCFAKAFSLRSNLLDPFSRQVDQ